MTKFKKLMACAVLFAACLITQLGTPIPVHAADAPSPDKGVKVTTCKLYGDNYYDLTIVNNTLIAKGKWARNSDPTQFNINLQLTTPVTYDDASVDGDGLVTVHAGNHMLATGPHYELETTLPIYKSSQCQGAKSIELSIPLSGLSDGIYCLRELVTKDGGSKYESWYGDWTLIVVQGGQASLQTLFAASQCSGLTQYNHSNGFWIM